MAQRPASKLKKAPAKKSAPAPKKAAKAKPAKAPPKPAAKRIPQPKPPRTVFTSKYTPAILKKPLPPTINGDGASRKKLVSKLNKATMEHFHELLMEKRREILGDVGSMESEAFKAGSNLSNMPIHMADVGTDNFEQEFTLGLIESERQILREIQEALLRLENGTFGICVATGKPIAKTRLEAIPWTKYTMEHALALESGLLHRDSSAQDDDSDSDDEEE